MRPVASAHANGYRNDQNGQESRTQNTLHEQEMRTKTPLSPTPLAAYLPALSYDPSIGRNPQPAPIDTAVTAHFDQSSSRDTQAATSLDPDDFYKEYNLSTRQAHHSLHQDAIHTVGTPIARELSNGSYSTNMSVEDANNVTSTPKVLGLKSRKSSVKNLVAQINASSTAEPPPIPSQPPSTAYAVQNATPYISSAHVSQFGDVRKYSNSSNRTSKRRPPRSSSGQIQPLQRRPLFGEIVSESTSNGQSAGYGISSPRRRAGSETSQMHHPSPMFPQEQRIDAHVLSPTAHLAASPPQEYHRRSQSEVLPNSSFNTTGTATVASRRPPVASRIPITRLRVSAASESEASAPSSRNPSSLSHRQAPYEGSTDTSNMSTAVSSELPRSVDSPISKITSPNRRGKIPGSQRPVLQKGDKSPLLRANIIAPPPKISPPLRSSRPRLPVSAASTAASRARMAEKFNSQQKLLNEKRAAQQRRSKPSELSDVDLDARRLRITQALTRSRESGELKSRQDAAQHRYQTKTTGLAQPADTDEPDAMNTVPEVRIGDGFHDASDNEEIDLQAGGPTRQALDMIGSSQRESYTSDSDVAYHPNEASSYSRPTGERGMYIQTSFLRTDDTAQPTSALTDATVETEATHIDPEPQEEAELARQTLLTHVMQIRAQSPSYNYIASRHSLDEHEDRTDAESVNLILRNTAYLDEDEAIRKGYRTNFPFPDPLQEEPELPESRVSTRDSWTSSIHDAKDEDDGYFDQEPRDIDHEQFRTNRRGLETQVPASQSESLRNTRASDAYTIINIVLQENSTSGIVDQQFADDVYQRVLETCPEIEEEEHYDAGKVERLCLEEILRRHEEDQASLQGEGSPQQDVEVQAGYSPTLQTSTPHADHAGPIVESLADNANFLTLPATTYQGHRHKSSLDSAEDWASTSPSVGDWARFAAANKTPPTEDDMSHDPSLQQTANNSVHKAQSQESPDAQTYDHFPGSLHASQNGLQDSEETVEPEEYGIAIIRAPSRSPPPPPKDNLPNILHVSRTATPLKATAETHAPQVPHRVASLSQMQRTASLQSVAQASSVQSRADVTPWETQDLSGEGVNPELKLLKQRKFVLRELVDSENAYSKDMRVVCDIYKQTAVAALSEDDIKVLFANVESIQTFARDFLTALKHAAKPLLSSDKKRDADGPLFASSADRVEDEIAEMQKDRQTQVGDAFEGSLVDMEIVYTEYIRNRHVANQRLEALNKSATAKEWLKECKDNSEDITHAWNLDALLVKPVQRITKYPLLLKELIDATAKDHPDLPTLKRVLSKVTDINIRINDVKKHTEMLDQAINRKRGQSDVRTGLSKAFGRRAEKLRQHVGIAEMYEDSEYDKVRIAYDNNYVQLMVVANDCLVYEKGMSQWVNKMVEVAAAAEAWVDVGHSHHQQEESKLRHLAMIIRNVQNIALPDHIEHLHKKVIDPMTMTVDILQKFKDDPKGLLHKRDKRLVDYAQMKNKKDRGEKIDKKMAERMDQWEALNTEAKERMRKLLTATAHLVQSCQGHLVQLQMTWLAMIQQKFSSVMGINLNRLSIDDIEKTWQEDFDFQEASALALGLCNGSLILQAANMTSFLTPGSTLVGDDSPRQMSFSSANKRSVSLNSDTSNLPPLSFSSRPSGTYSHDLPPETFDRPYPYPNTRTRAVSTTSGKSLHKPDSIAKTSTTTKHASASAQFARPGTSPSLSQQEVLAPPRLSVETLSPLMSSFPVGIQNERPSSSSTFFSAAPAQSQSQTPSSGQNRGSGVFSSAMPMSDSPVQDRQSQEPLGSDPKVLFTAASVYEFNIDRARREAGFPYLTYVTGEIFDVIGERGELWLARNQDDPNKQVGWIWNKHFAKLAE